VAEEIVTLPPEALSVPDKVLVLPTRTLPKARDVGFAAREIVEAIPVPVSETVGLIEALLTNEIWPDAPPADAGVNFAVYVADWPALSVRGRVIPLPLNPVPDVVICEIVKFAFPVLLIEMDCVPLLPTLTLPKLTLAGLTESWGAGAETAVPLSNTTGLLEALLANEIWPDTLPTVVGANCAV
jgi:hypothetical protein